MGVRLNGSTSGYVELNAPATAGTTVLELPTDSIKPGMVLVAAQDFTATSSFSINNCFTSTYHRYRIILETFGASVRADLQLRLRASGTDNTAGVYKYTYLGYRSDTGTEQTQNTSNSMWALMTANGTDIGLGVYDIQSPALARTTTIVGTGMRLNDLGTVGFLSFGGAHSVGTAFDGFTLFPNGGTFQGAVRVYGYRNS